MSGPTTFGYTGATVTYTVPQTGLYDIVASGAHGGAGETAFVGIPGISSLGIAGGLGAEIGGDVELTAGEVLTIVVGGQGASNILDGGGGGGGSFVLAPSNTPLVIAAGGGGGGGSLDDNGVVTGTPGGNGNAGSSGSNGTLPAGGTIVGLGGTGGSGGGGDAETDGAGGGGGLNSAGGSGIYNNNTSIGNGGSADGGAGGNGVIGGTGGFGGGGGGGLGGGGGGGYSGGGGGGIALNNDLNGGGGGGGGSFDASTVNNADLVQRSGVQSGNGSVTITPLVPIVVPESFSANYGAAITLTQAQLLAGDTDPQGGTLNVTAVGTGSGAVLNPNGTVTYTAPSAPVAGNTASFTYTVTDTAGFASNATATIGLTAPLVASTITGTKANQTTTDEKTISPFSGVTIADPNAGSPTDAVTITLANTQGAAPTDADGTLSGTGLSKTGTGTYTLAAASPATLTGELDALSFTPTGHQAAQGSSVTTTFTIADTNSASQTATDSTTSVVATAVNDAPTISGTKAGQAVSNNATIPPFTGVSITDPDVGVQDSLTITLAGAGGTLSGTGLSPTGTAATYSLAAASPATLSSELDALIFTPASGAPGTVNTTTFTLVASQSAGGSTVTATDNTTSVIDTVPLQASTITVPSSDQPQTSTGLAAVTPLAGVTITDPNPGGTETVTITPSSTTSGTLSDPNAATDHSTTSNGAITLTGAASAVTTDLDALTFTPAFGQFGTTTFTIADTNSAKQTTTPPATASVTVTPPPPPTAAQLKQVGTDLLQFYKDELAHKSTTADTSKLATDFTTLDISQAELGQLLGQTLTSATLSSAAATTLGADIAATYYPKITTDLAHGGQGLAPDLTAMIGTTVAAGADDLLRTHFGQSASQALAGTVQDFKLA